MTSKHVSIGMALLLALSTSTAQALAGDGTIPRVLNPPVAS